MPAPATCNVHVREKRGLVLDVLDAHAVRAPEEDGERVRRIDEALDLDAGIFRVALVVVRGVDEDGEMVEQRTLRISGIALVELDVRAADLDARHAVLRRRRREAVVEVRLRRDAGIGRDEGDVIEVVVDLGPRFHEAHLDSAREARTDRGPRSS